MPLFVEVLLGLYLGLLTGILPALVAGTLGFPGLLDETIRRSPRLVTATLVVLVITLEAHSQGDRLGAEFPRRPSSSAAGRNRNVSADSRRAEGVRRGHPTISSSFRCHF